MSDSGSAINYEQKGDIAIVTMDDGKANALSHSLLAGLKAAITRAESEAQAMILVGRERRFCAGFDLTQMMAGPDAARDLLTRGADVMMHLYGSPLPTIAACTGHALAGGALLLLCCDTRIGTAGAFKIGLNEVSIGMPVPVLAQRLATDRIARQHLCAATMRATIYDPPGAAAVGYLDRFVEADALLEAAMAEATRLASLPAHAYAFTKASLREASIQHINNTLESNIEQIGGAVGG